MLINIDNYEIYAIDYLEDALGFDLKEEMDLFLQNHPDIKSELEGMRTAPTMETDNSITFDGKAGLLKEKEHSVFWIYRYAIAAGLAFLLAFVWTMNRPVQENTLAEESKPKMELIDQVISSETNLAAIDNGEQDLKIDTDIQNTVAPHIEKPAPKQNDQVKSENMTAVNYPSVKQDPKIIEPIMIVEKKAIVQVMNIESIVQDPRQSIRESIAALPHIDLASIQLNLESNSVLNHEGLIAAIPVNASSKKKQSWILDAITKKSDGSNVFAFGAIKKALTPSRYRDATVDKSSIESPIKIMTNDE